MTAELRLRLRPPAAPVRTRLARLYERLVLAAILAAVAAGALPPLWTFQVHGPAELFAVAVGLAFLALLVPALRAAGPVAASAAFRFWLLATPVRRRELLRRRYLALLAGAGVVTFLLLAPASVASAAVFAGAAVILAATAVWAQTSEVVDRVLHAAGHLLGGAGLLAFGSLATGIGRAGLSSVTVSPALPAILALAVVFAVLAYRALDRLDLAALSRGAGLWSTARAAAGFLDVLLLTEFLTEERSRKSVVARPIPLPAWMARSPLRLEWSRLRRRPLVLARIPAAALVWWGCHAVFSGSVLMALAVVGGYCVVLPMAATLRQFSARPGLRAQFAGAERQFVAASVGVCGLVATLWTVALAPGLTAVSLAAMPVGITAAVWRTVTRPPLDYSAAPVSTPFGDIPVDLLRQLLRGPLLLAVLIVALTV